MKFAKYAPENVFAIYVDSEGNEYEQPISDITEAGTLIDPETDDDMEIVRVDVRLDS